MKGNTLRTSGSTMMTSSQPTIDTIRTYRTLDRLKSKESINSAKLNSQDEKLFSSPDLILIKKERKNKRKIHIKEKLDPNNINLNNNQINNIPNKKSNSLNPLPKLENISIIISQGGSSNIDQNGTGNHTKTHSLTNFHQGNIINSSNKNVLQKINSKISTKIGGSFVFKSSLKKHCNFKTSQLGVNYNTNITPYIPKKKNVRFVDQNNFILDDYEDFVNLPPQPLAQVIKVESYRHFNIYAVDRYDSEEEDDPVKVKVKCKCNSCLIF